MPRPGRRGARPVPFGAVWLVLFPLVLHLPHLSGWLSENPAYVTADLALPGAARHGPLLGQPGFIDGNSGVTVQALGGLAARDWLAGRVPWWNPYSGLGLPLAAELQNGAFFLPFVLLLRCFNGVVWLKIVLQGLAGLATRGLLAELGLAPLAALAASLAFQANGSFAWFGHGPILPIAFLPLLLWGVERARWRAAQGAVLVGLGIGFSLLAGFPEVAYLDGLLALLLALLRFAQDGFSPRFAAALVVGGLAGLLLAAPPLLAFALALPHEFISYHRNFAATVLPPPARAAMVFPYLFGPPLHGGLALRGAASVAAYIAWYRQCAYLDLPMLLLAALAVRPGARQFGLRVAFAGFVVLALGRVLGAPLLLPLVNLVPLLRHSMAQLYLLPACQMALTVLAACALDDGLTDRSPRGVPWPALVMLALALATLPGATAEWRRLATVPGAIAYPVVSVLFGVLAGLAVVWAARGRRAIRAVWLVPGYAGVMFMVPLLCGTPRPRGLDHAAIMAMRGLPPLARLVSADVLAPNYGAWLGVRQADSNYLPSPQNWVDWLQAHNPGTDGVNFYPTVQHAADFAHLRQLLPALAAHGVSYLALRGPPDAFYPRIAPALPPPRHGLGLALPLLGTLSVTLPGRIVSSGQAVALWVTIGTYRSQVSGMLAATLCQEGRCVSGTVPLAGARDNAPLIVRLGGGLALSAGKPVTYTLHAVSGRGRPPAIWAVPGRQAGTRIGPNPPMPRIAVLLAPPPGTPTPIFTDPLMTLFRLHHVTPFYSAPGCALSGAGAARVSVDCAGPSRLVRQELAFPGWRVRVNGVWQRLGSDGLVQAVLLPAGRSDLVFRYAPSGAALAMAGSGLGAAMLAGLAWLGLRSSGRRRMIGRSIV